MKESRGQPKLAHLNKLSKAGNFLKCLELKNWIKKLMALMEDRSPSRCNSFLACLIAFAFCFSSKSYRHIDFIKVARIPCSPVDSIW